jgi:hypothetical protein
MARVRLGRREAETGDLPAVCMRCGEPSTLVRRKSFAWHPLWVYALVPVFCLPFIVVAMVLTKHMRVQVPLCDAHKRHWRIRLGIIWGSFLALVLSSFAAVIIVSSLDQGDGGRDSGPGAWVCLGPVVGAFCWLISIPIIQHTLIHATEITDHSITLTQVSDGFVRAWRAYRAATDDEAAAERRRGRDPRSEDAGKFHDVDAARRPWPKPDPFPEDP